MSSEIVSTASVPDAMTLPAVAEKKARGRKRVKPDAEATLLAEKKLADDSMASTIVDAGTTVDASTIVDASTTVDALP